MNISGTIIFNGVLSVESFLVLPRSCTNRRRKLVHLGMSGGVRFLKREKIVFLILFLKKYFF